MIYTSKQEVQIMGPALVSIINLSNDAGISYLPQIAVSGNNVYVVWTDETTAVNNLILILQKKYR